jgi:hypothetical protein
MEVIKASGILFGGDMHLASASRAPSRRRSGYREAGLDKLGQLVDIANEGRLVLVLTGDIFHRPREPSESLKTRLKRILARCWTPVLSNVGNHDKDGTRLDDDDSLAMVAEASSALRIFRHSGPGCIVDIDGMRVGLGFTPYGQAIPTNVSADFPDCGFVMWVTHHDVAFEGAYPNSLEPHAIRGCNIVVNGHMHLYKTPVTVGETTWCNFGSVMRTAIDAIDHEPCGWSYDGANLVAHPLKFERDAFDLTGRLVEEASPGEVVAAAGSSVFVDMLEAARREVRPATADGALLLEALEAKMAGSKARPEIRAMAMDLYRRAVADRQAAPV